MDAIFGLTQRLAYPLMRIAMGIVLFWIGALKFIDPTPVVELLGASLSFLAFPAVVYLLGAVEVILAIMLFARIAVRFAGLALMGLFSGTILIFLIAPKVAYGPGGFPMLSLPGEFLLKDLVLFAASMAIVAMETSQMPVADRRMRGAQQYATAK